MNGLFKSFVTLSVFALLSCQQESLVESQTTSIDSNKYYTEEIIPHDYQKIYGMWKLYDISGGFAGTGYEPDFDYLEIKAIGIYGLIRKNNLFEYGKIEIFTFDTNASDLLQIKLIPDNSFQQNKMSPPEKYVRLIGNDSLDLISPCCDMFNYHFKRVE